MIRANGLTTPANYYGTNVNQAKSTAKANGNIQAQKNSSVIGNTENKLSDKAKNYLEKLRNDMGDFDFIIADKGDDFKGAVKHSTKEFSVILSSDEIERMASDEKYAEEKISAINGAVNMSRKINEQYAIEHYDGKNTETLPIINKLTITFNEDGSMTLFADLQKFSEKLQKTVDDAKEKAENEKQSEKQKFSVKYASVQASSEEELYKKISEFDWSKVPEEKNVTGAKFDMSV